KTTQVASGTGKPVKKPTQNRLTGYSLDPDHLGHHRVAPQIGDLRELLGATEQPLEKPKSLAQGRQTVVGFGQRMRQTFFQQTNPAAPMQIGPEGGRAGVRAELLVGKLDLDGLIGTLELN